MRNTSYFFVFALAVAAFVSMSFVNQNFTVKNNIGVRPDSTVLPSAKKEKT